MKAQANTRLKLSRELSRDGERRLEPGHQLGKILISAPCPKLLIDEEEKFIEAAEIDCAE